MHKTLFSQYVVLRTTEHESSSRYLLPCGNNLEYPATVGLIRCVLLSVICSANFQIVRNDYVLDSTQLYHPLAHLKVDIFYLLTKLSDIKRYVSYSVIQP